MKEVFDFIYNNWAIIASILFSISELMALNPKWKSSGLIDLIQKFLKK